MAIIGSGYLQNFLSGGAVKKGIGVLTQKRFYFKGHNFSGTGKAIKSRTEEGVVSIDDIAFTKFIYTRPIGLLVTAFLLLFGAILCGFAGVLLDRNVAELCYLIAAALAAAALVFFIRYFISRQTLFQVSFPGGGFAFDIKYYPISDIRDFQRQLHLLKDHVKEEAAV